MLGAIAGAAGAFLSSGAGQSMLAGLGNSLGGMANSATGYYYSKKMAKYNYDLQMQGYKQFPTAQVEGLRAAGVNPMIAYGGMSGATAHAQNYAPGSDSRAGSSAIEAYQKAKQNELAEKNLASQIDVNSANATKAKAEAAAALKNAETNRMSVDKMAPRDPNNDPWAKGSYITDSLGSTGTALGGTALAAKGIKDVVSKTPTIPNTVGQSKNQYIKPTSKTKPTVVNSGKSAGKVIKDIAKKVPVIAVPAAAAGTVYGVKKLGDAYDKSKNAKKMKDDKYWSHGNWSR